jgi:hypothetical protein
MTGADSEASWDRAFVPGELKEDLAAIVDALKAVHPRPEIIPLVSSPASRIELEGSLTRPMPRLAFCVRVAPLVNWSPDGHTFLNLPYEEIRAWSERGGRLLPWDLTLRAVEGPGDGAAPEPARRVRAYVAARHGDGADVPRGTEALAINGVPLAMLVERLLPYPPGETLARRLVSLGYGFRGLLWSVCGVEGPYTLTLRPADGDRERTVTHPGVSDAQLRAEREAAASGAGAVQRAPYRYESWPEEGIGLIDFRDFDDAARFAGFLEETLARIRRERVHSLIVDLRRNDGGYSKLGDMLLAYLADRPVTQFKLRQVKVSAQIKTLYRGEQAEGRQGDLHYREILEAPDGSLLTLPGNVIAPRVEAERFRGDLYVLIGPATYSSAVMLASAVKDHGLGTLVGEETGGTATQYADLCPVTLPNTDLQMRISHQWILRPSGADNGRGVLPDIQVPAAEALERARALIASMADAPRSASHGR